MKKIFEAIMAIFINGIEFLTGFLKGKEYEGWMQGEKIWPADEISITYVQFLLEALPEGYTGLTKLTQIPACGATVRSAILTYQYDDGWGEHHIGEIQVEFTDGAISAESKYYTESGATLVGTRHADFEIDGVEFKDFAIEVYQEANVITKTDRSEPAVPLKEDAWYYYTPDIKAFSYTGAGLLASGGNATPSFRVSITKIMSRYLKTEKTWKDMQSTAMEQVGMAPRQIDVMGGVEEWVDISAPVTIEYTDTASGEVTIKFDASNLIAAASLVSHDTGVISVASMGTTAYPNGRTIGNTKIIVSVPRIRTGEQSRVEKSVTLSQGANTMTQEWRVTTAATTTTEYAWEQPTITSISCALVGASGSPAKVIVAYSQNRYKYQYNISERKTLYEVWTSGEEVSTGMSTGGDKTLASKTVASTITSGGTLAFGGSVLNNSGATIDSSGWVTGVSLYRTVTEERDIFKAWATVTANGLTSAKSYVTVRQHYNHQYTENMSEGTAVTTIEYDYSAPSVTLKYYTGAGEESSKVTARGGSLYPKIKATQTSRTRSHTVGPTTWVWNYWDADPDGVETDKKTADYYSEWIDGQSYETTSLSDVVQWYGDEAKNGASVASKDGTVSVPSLGTTSFSEGNVLKVVATVRMNGKTANGYCYISQGSNTKTVKSTTYTGITSAELIDASGNKITDVLSCELQTIFIRTQASTKITYEWTSGSTSTEAGGYEYKRADSYLRSNESMFEITNNWNTTLKAVPVTVTRNNSTTNRRSGYITATIYNNSKTTQSVTQEVYVDRTIKNKYVTSTDPNGQTVGGYILDGDYVVRMSFGSVKLLYLVQGITNASTGATTAGWFLCCPNFTYAANGIYTNRLIVVYCEVGNDMSVTIGSSPKASISISNMTILCNKLSATVNPTVQKVYKTLSCSCSHTSKVNYTYTDSAGNKTTASFYGYVSDIIDLGLGITLVKI